MKKGFLGILALTLIFGMVLIGCDDGSDGSGENGEKETSSIVGTWSWTGTGTVTSGGAVYGISSFTIIFKDDNTYELKEYITTINDNSWNGYMMAKGTYSVDGNAVVITQTHHSENEGDTWEEVVPPMVIGGITFTSTTLSFPASITTVKLTRQSGSGGNGNNGNEGIQVYNQDGTVFTGNDTGTIWYANGFRETERGNNAVAANINITNGKITNFSLPESVNENLLHNGFLGGPESAKTGVLMITLSSGKNLILLSENSTGYNFYSKGSKNNVKIDESFEGDFNITVGWNCLVLSMNGSIVSNSKINNFNDYKWTIYNDNGKTFVGSWTKTVSNDVRLLVINDDGTWNVFINDVPYVSDNPGIWSETNNTIGIWYDYISETHPEPGYVYATYTLSENGDSFTLSGDAELLFGGTEPWTRVNN